jgi:L-asparaginase/Glu-tRNA(Gln) amidotransferase subunit D
VHRAAQRGVAVLVASAAHTPNRGADLLPFGAAGAGGLPAQKARLALMAGLSCSSDPASAFAFVHRYSNVHDFGDRSSS